MPSRYWSCLNGCIGIALLAAAGGLYGQESVRTTWWLAADSHVGRGHTASTLAAAVADVNALGIAHYGIVLGDLVQRDTHVEQTFVATMNGLNADWTHVLGNHDSGGPLLAPNYNARSVHGVRFMTTVTSQGFNEYHLKVGFRDSWGGS